MSRPPVNIRAYRPKEDESFVMHSWLRHFHQSHCPAPDGEKAKRVKYMGNTRYFGHYQPLVSALLAKPSTQVLIACDPRPEESAFIFGWICYTHVQGQFPRMVHYMYVKDLYRRSGVARFLATTAGITPESEVLYTFEADTAKHLAPKVAAAEYYPIERYLR